MNIKKKKEYYIDDLHWFSNTKLVLFIDSIINKILRAHSKDNKKWTLDKHS